MEKAEIELEVLTPMFSYGNEEVEFRLTELKSLMRSTFRELYYFKDLKNMKDTEKWCFGSTDEKSPVRRSPVSFVIKKNINPDKDIDIKSPLPHKNFKPIKCIKNSTKICFYMICKDDFRLDFYVNLLIQSSIIGSMGRYSRKGFGSFKINKIQIDGDYKYDDLLSKSPICILKELSHNNPEKLRRIEHEDVGEKTVSIEFCEYKDKLDYPYIKKLRVLKIKNEYGELIKAVSQLTHDRLYSKNNKDFIDGIENREVINRNVLGNCGGQRKGIKRFASPICVSFWENKYNKYMIIKELNYNYIFNELNINTQKDKEANKAYVDKYVRELIKIGEGK